MRAQEVHLGKVYAVKVSGKVVPVKLERVRTYGGWFGTNQITKREIRIRTAAKLRYELAGHKDVTARQGHYITAYDAQDAADRIRKQLDIDEPLDVQDWDGGRDPGLTVRFAI